MSLKIITHNFALISGFLTCLLLCLPLCHSLSSHQFSLLLCFSFSHLRDCGNPWNRRDRGCRQGATATLECGPPEQIRVESPSSRRGWWWWGGLKRESKRWEIKRVHCWSQEHDGIRVNKLVNRGVDRKTLLKTQQGHSSIITESMWH